MEQKALNADEVRILWEQVKAQERDKKQRKTALEGIPNRLGIVLKLQKLLRIFHKMGLSWHGSDSAEEEDRLADEVCRLITYAESIGVDLEGVLRRRFHKEGEWFMEWEKKQH